MQEVTGLRLGGPDPRVQLSYAGAFHYLDPVDAAVAP